MSITRSANDPSPLHETLKAWAIIGEMEKTVEFASHNISEQSDRIDQHQTEINLLMGAINLATKTLEAQQSYLAFLNTHAQSFLLAPEANRLKTKGIDMEVRRIWDQFKIYWENLASRHVKSVQNEINVVKEEVEELLTRQKALLPQLDKRRTMYAEAERSRNAYERIRLEFNIRINAKKSTLRSFRRLPSEIWIQIFEMCVHAEFIDYIRKNGNSPMESTPFILSQVCRFWRRIITNSPTLWTKIAIHPSEYWSKNKASHFHDCLISAPPTTTFVANLSQALSWRPPTSFVPTVKPLSFGSDSYQLHLDMEKFTAEVQRKATLIPYRQPIGLIISARQRVYRPSKSHILDLFQSVQSLSFVNEYPGFIPIYPLSTALPKLTVLKFHIPEFPVEINLLRFLSSTLKELHIRHEGQKELPHIFEEVHLPSLSTIGVTYPSMHFLKKLKLPVLTKLVIYRPQKAAIPMDLEEIHYLSHVHTLELVDWDVFKTELDQLDAVDVCRMFVRRIGRLRCLSFVRNLVDGEALIALVRERLQELGQGVTEVEDITLSRSGGIKRSECEILASLIERLHVYL